MFDEDELEILNAFERDELKRSINAEEDIMLARQAAKATLRNFCTSECIDKNDISKSHDLRVIEVV